MNNMKRSPHRGSHSIDRVMTTPPTLQQSWPKQEIETILADSETGTVFTT